jgi:16S rRNA (cytosine967-C5)-methyltransferase
MRELAPSYDADPIGHLEVTCSHPRWIIEAYRDVLGELDHVRALLVANNTPAPVTLAVRPGLAQLSDLADIPGEPGRWSPFGWRLAGGSPATVSLVQDGRVGVQDEGSQLAAQALAAAAPGGRWLDLCAGPGGKAALLAGLARSGTAGGSSSAPSDAERSGPAAPRAELLAVEREPHRARLVADALRAYTSVPRVVVADGTVPPWNDASFDAVLVDVPCTGLGALRRRPESRWRRQPADLDSLVPLQRRLLASALDSTRPGGVVGYVTCSPHRDETVGVVESVCATREDIEPMDTPRVLAEAIGAEAADFGRGPYVQLWPHVHDTDAMFVALLRRRDL